MAKTENQIQKWEAPSPRQYLVAERKMLSEMFAPTGLEYRPFELSALMLLADTPSLQACLGTREGAASLRNALMKAAATGLSLNPAEGKATIIAYNGQATYQIMKNGLIEEAMRSGSVAFMTCDLVREKDTFAIRKRITGDEYEHELETRHRGPVIGYYAACLLKDGAQHVRYMTVEEAQEHRNRYVKTKSPGSMWGTSFDGAALKTVLKSLLRNLHLAPTTREIISRDDADETEWDVDTVHVGSSASDITEALRDRAAEPEPSAEAAPQTPTNIDDGRKPGDLL